MVDLIRFVPIVFFGKHFYYFVEKQSPYRIVTALAWVFDIKVVPICRVVQTIIFNPELAAVYPVAEKSGVHIHQMNVIILCGAVRQDFVVGVQNLFTVRPGRQSCQPGD